MSTIIIGFSARIHVMHGMSLISIIIKFKKKFLIAKKYSKRNKKSLAESWKSQGLLQIKKIENLNCLHLL